MKKFILKIFLCGVLCLMGISNISQPTPYTDETSWRNAVSNGYALENFDSVATGTEIFQLPSLGIAFDPLDDGTQPAVQPYSSTGGIARAQPNC